MSIATNDLAKRERHFIEAHEKLLEQNKELKRQLAMVSQTIPASIERQMEMTQNQKRYEQELREAAEAEFQQKFDTVIKQKEQHLKNVKQQEQYFLSKRNEEMKHFVKEYNEYKAQKDFEVQGLLEEGSYLCEYLCKLATLLEKVETGAWTLKDKTGLRTFI